VQKFKKLFAAAVNAVAALAALPGKMLPAARAWARSYGARAGFAMGGNTITNLIPLLYAALDTVSRELVGLHPGRGARLQRRARSAQPDGQHLRRRRRPPRPTSSRA
jgi:hypothetical protein